MVLNEIEHLATILWLGALVASAVLFALAPGALLAFVYSKCTQSIDLRSIGRVGRVLLFFVCLLAILPVKWVAGYLGSYTSNWVLTVFSLFGFYAWLRLSGSLRAFLADLLCLIAAFVCLALIFFGAWFEAEDIATGKLGIVKILDQSDLWIHFILQQQLAFGNDFGPYHSPIGYPGLLTTGSYSASQLSAIIQFFSTFGMHQLWNTSLAKLSIFSSFFMFVLSLYCISDELTRQNSSRPREFLDCTIPISGMITWSLAWSYALSPTFVANPFIHSINNGIGSAVIALTLAILLLARRGAWPVTQILVFTLLLMTILAYSRANWIFFTGGLAVVLLAPERLTSDRKGEFDWKTRIHQMSSQLLRTHVGLLAIYGVLLVLSLTIIQGLFGAESYKPQFTSSVGAALAAHHTYYLWFPAIYEELMRIAPLANATRSLLLSITLELLLALLGGIPFYLARAKMIGSVVAVGLGLIGMSRFLIVPFPGADYGTTEPLGNTFMLNYTIYSIGLLVVVTRCLMSSPPFIRLSFLIVISLFATQSAYLFESASEDRPYYQFNVTEEFDEIRRQCHSREILSIYHPSEVAAALSGCVSIGKYRYTKKLTADLDLLEPLHQLVEQTCLNETSQRALIFPEKKLAVFCNGS